MATAGPVDNPTVSDDEMSDDGEPRLQIVDLSNVDEKECDRSVVTTSSISFNDDSSNASEAVESLLMLGMGDSWSRNNDTLPKTTSTSRSRRFSSGYELSSSYYQKMRERNNEASKRCRMKRRLKAVSLEGQLDLLTTSNVALKNRLSRMERLSEILRDAIRGIQPERCSCAQTVQAIKKVNADTKDSLHLTTSSILKISKSQRQIDPELSAPPSSSDEDLAADVMANFRRSNSAAGMSNDPPLLAAMPPAPPPLLSTGAKPKTVLDILNDTIIQSLGTSPTIKTELPVPSLKNVKVEPASSSSSKASKPVILSVPCTTGPRKEFEVFVVENIKNEALESNCVAAANLATNDASRRCEGNLINVNELTCVLNTITGKSGQNCSASGSSATERVLILSRLGLPFWDDTEASLLICEGHRTSIIESSLEQVCVLCGIERATRIDSAQSITFLITQSMSKQNHFQNGKILPVGRLVCGLCKNTHLRGIDTSSSQILMPKINGMLVPQNLEAQKVLARHTVASVKPSTAAKRTGPCPDLEVHAIKIRPSPPCFSTAKSTNKVQVIIQPVQKDIPRSQPNTSHATDLSSNKIVRLNEALKDLNPDYNPIGFSITSVKSCSPATLHEAVRATETAISTLMSVIAPGQEEFLWESIRPILDSRLAAKGAEKQ